MGCSKSDSQRKVHSVSAYLKMKNPSNNLKKLERITKPKLSRRKEVTKIRAEINETETKKTTKKVSETKSGFFEKRNKIEKPLARLTNKKERMLNEIKSEIKETLKLLPRKCKGL